MAFDRTNLFFNTLRRRDGRTAFVLLHAGTGLALTMAEAAEVEGLPEGFTLDRHTALPGRAAWLFDGDPIKAGFTLVGAGFSGSREDIGKIASAAAAPAPGKPPRDAAPEAPQAPGNTSRRFVYNYAFRMEDGVDVMRIAVAACSDDPTDPQIWTDDDIPPHRGPSTPGLTLPACVVADSRDRWRFRGIGSPEAVTAALEKAGLVRDTRIWLWLEPSEAEFGVAEDDPDEPPILIVYPKDETCPFHETMRDCHLKEIPGWIDANVMENGWQAQPGVTRDRIIADMKARGYTHDPQFDAL